MNDDDTGLCRSARRSEFNNFAVEQYLACVGAVNARQDLHQRRLARPVLADDGMDRAAARAETHPVERLHARKTLADVARLENERHKRFRFDPKGRPTLFRFWRTFQFRCWYRPRRR